MIDAVRMELEEINGVLLATWNPLNGAVRLALICGVMPVPRVDPVLREVLLIVKLVDLFLLSKDFTSNASRILSIR